MAVKRALVFRAGSVGPTCAATDVAIEKGTLANPGTLRPIRECTNPATVLWKGTGFCVECRDVIRRSSSIGVVQSIQRKEGD
jgi:hypothetical protein